MIVLCPECGRECDASPLPFDRTVDCACGEQISVKEPTAPSADWRNAPAPRFVADAMLGRLARWLRLIGADTAYEAHIEDRRLADRGRLEGRVVLTRDTVPPRRFKNTSCLLIETEVLAEQLAQVAVAFGIDWRAGAFSRYTRCNAPLERLTPDEAAGRVPPRVLREQEVFLDCRSCRRVYWRGSHVERMRAKLARALAEASHGP